MGHLLYVAGPENLSPALVRSELRLLLHKHFAFGSRNFVVVTRALTGIDLVAREIAGSCGLHWTEYRPDGSMTHDCGLHWNKRRQRGRREEPPPAPDSWLPPLELGEAPARPLDVSQVILDHALERVEWGWGLEGIGLHTDVYPTPDPLLERIRQLGGRVKNYFCRQIPELEPPVWLSLD